MNSRDKTLSILESNFGSFISGERIASKLGISRNCVWKAVNSLRRDGYPIEAVTNQGYRLSDKFDHMSEVSIRHFVPEAMQDRIFYSDTTESTNKTAIRMALDGAPHGTMIIAGSQTQGKGHKSRSFFSPPGGIYMSIILRPSELLYRIEGVLSALVAVSICEEILEINGGTPRIKPINSIFINHKKVCGILTESASDIDTGEREWIVVGIGIYFSTKGELFSEHPNIYSIFPDGNPPISRSQFIGNVISRIYTLEKLSCSEILKKYENLKIDLSSLQNKKDL